MNTSTIDVSVYMLTYFHEKYLRQALESILTQKTKYNFEVVISDDCSQDGTVTIINEYLEKYPDKIRAIFNEKNIGIPKNVFQARCACKGRYIVSLSGDDYWIDPLKIEKLASFLDEHSEYIAVCNAMELRYDDDLVSFKELPTKVERNIVFTLKDYENGKIVYTHGFMMRNFFLTEEGRMYFKQAQEISDKVDDAVDNILLLRKGNMFVLDEVTDVYRVPRNKEGLNSYNARYSRVEKQRNSIDLLNNLHNIFGSEINLKKKYTHSFSVALVDMLIGHNKKEYMDIYNSIPESYRKPVIKGVFISSIPEAIHFSFNRVIDRLRSKA